MKEKYLKKLEYDKILEILSSFCITYIGKDLCGNLRPCNKYEQVEYLLNETNQGYILYREKGIPPIHDIPNIDIWIKTLDSIGILKNRALLEIASILKLSRELKEYFYSDPVNSNNFNIISKYFSDLYCNKNIEDNISNYIINENTIADNASHTLSVLRKKKKSLEQQIKENLNSLIHSPKNSRYIQQPIVTIRNDRYVIPVKEEFKNSIKGLIHDISSSGSTVFIEPMVIFDLNNEINSLKIKENIEIENILKDLSCSLYPITKELIKNINIIGKLDFIFAKVKYSIDIDAVCPKLNSDKHVNLIKARHPMICKDIVIPIDIYLGDKFSTLVITGANAGGKTVALKTFGLLILMALSGLYIPAYENSSVFVFDNIFADIGDEQSIEGALSTFSAHISNIVQITNCVTKNSLVLLDELGSGTDPVEGARLAISILEFFHNLDVLTISTTHYQEIKNYVLITDGFEVASLDFDIDNLKPTYKVLMGVPGRSNALAISKKLGLNEDILSRAISLINDDDINIEELFKKIYDNKIAIEEEKEIILKNSNQIKLLKKSLEKDYCKVKSQEKEIIENAKIKARDLLLDAKDQANIILGEMRDNLKNIDKEKYNNTQSLKNSLNKSIKDINLNISKNNNKNNTLKSNEIKIGMQVYIYSLKQTGTILALPNNSNKVLVQVGNIKTNIDIDNLSKVDNINTNKKNNIQVKSNINLESKSISPQINVIGLNVEEANYIIDKYLDDSRISNIKSVTIIHGKGTGSLKSGIHAFLKNHPHVKNYRLGTFGEGEMGVTIVELNT